MKTYYEKNKARIAKYAKEYARKNPEKIKAYRKKNREKQRNYYRLWYKKNGRNRTVHDMEMVREWCQEHPDRRKIHGQVQRAVRRGDIDKPAICSRCGRETRLHAHHIDYNHFMNFIWLCASCHKREHIVGFIVGRAIKARKN